MKITNKVTKYLWKADSTWNSFFSLYYNWFQHKVLLAKFCNASTVLMIGCILCAMLHFVQNHKTIVLLCICWWQSQLSLSNFLKPILILCRVDLFLYGTERMICQIKRQGWMVGIWDWIFFMAEHVNMWVSHNLLGLVSCCMYSCSYRKIIKMQSRLSHSFVVCSNAQCAVCAVWVPRNRTSWDIS